jgi:hypothetical protein
MATQWISWESPDEMRIASLQWEEESRKQEEIWEALESSSTPNDFIGFLSPEMEKESSLFWEREYQRHLAAESEIAAILSEMGDEEPDDSGWDGLVSLGNGIRG